MTFYKLFLFYYFTFSAMHSTNSGIHYTYYVYVGQCLKQYGIASNIMVYSP